jgi:hypothetical protein
MTIKRAFAATALIAAGVLFAATGTAGADPVSVLVADGSDPSATGCASDAYTARSAYGAAAGANRLLVELRYSPRCKTAWARMTTMNMPSCQLGVSYCGRAEVTRNSDGRTYECRLTNGTHGCYTPQVNDNGVTSYGWGTVDYGSTYASALTGSY